LNKNKQKIKRQPKIKFIVNESFNGTKSRIDLFSDMILSTITTTDFTLRQNDGIIKIPTVKS